MTARKVWWSGAWLELGGGTEPGDGTMALTSAASALGVQLTTVGSTNTKGAWTQLVASTSVDLAGLWFSTLAFGSASTPRLVDIGIGAAASEQVLVANLTSQQGGAGASTEGDSVFIPIAVPAGSRLSARYQATNTAGTQYVNLTGQIGGPSYSNVDTYGATTADSGGIVIDPGGTANTKGAWVELTSSTARRHRALIVGVSSRGNVDLSSNEWLVDIATGAASSETVRIANVHLRSDVQGDSMGPQLIGPIDVDIAASSRLAVRASSRINDATDRLFDVVLYGVG
jgi:hypothetical protein